MAFELFEQLPSMLPLEFFALSASILYTKSDASTRALPSSFLLPSTAELLGEEKFADVAVGWSEEGIRLDFFVDKELENVAFPAFAQGDAIELFFDTRDLKTTGFATRFCHHFLVLPEHVQGIQAQEMTHFRTEDRHALCDPQDLTVHVARGARSYEVRLFIPAHCLHGYDPQVCDRIGFTYRIHRHGGSAQHFAVSSQHFPLEQSPRLWASLTMVKKK